MSRASGIESVIYSFRSGSDGAAPNASLLVAVGAMYGTTLAGGGKVGSTCYSSGCGTVYRVTPDGQETVIYAFSGPDGTGTKSSLIETNGTFYGTTDYGGAHGVGTVYSLTKSGTQHVLHSFSRKADGETPESGLIDVNGTMYGTTSEGGEYNSGTVFSITRSGRERVLYSFKGGSYGDGYEPLAGLTQVGGDLYGTTSAGGSGAGTVFKITTAGKERVLYRFAPYGGDAEGPASTLVNVGGTLYGTTRFSPGDGTVFSVSTSGKERVLHVFKGPPDGQWPYGGLVNVNGTLYGTTDLGGLSAGSDDYGFGTIYSISPSGKERVIYRFAGPPDGADAPSALVDFNGTLFGVTSGGGTTGNGTVFALPLSTQRRSD